MPATRRHAINPIAAFVSVGWAKSSVIMVETRKPVLLALLTRRARQNAQKIPCRRTNPGTAMEMMTAHDCTGRQVLRLETQSVERPESPMADADAIVMAVKNVVTNSGQCSGKTLTEEAMMR